MHISTRPNSETIVHHTVNGTEGGGHVGTTTTLKDYEFDVRITDASGMLQAGRVKLELKGACLSLLAWDLNAKSEDDPEFAIILCDNIHQFQKESATWLTENGA